MDERILELARGISGAGESELGLLEALCRAAQQSWRMRLRAGVSETDCGEALCCAAAFTAAADLTAGRGGGAVSGFTAGAVSIQGRSASDGAALALALRQTAERLMAPYAEAANLSFRGVRG